MAECAVWYMRYGASSYALCDDEAEAVGFATALDDSAEGSVMGVQFADGRLIERDEWQALKDYQEQQDAAMRAAPAMPSSPMRSVRDPFGGQTVDVAVNEPEWLGA